MRMAQWYVRICGQFLRRRTHISEARCGAPGKASKPLSLHPVKFEDAVSALLKTPPMPKPVKK